MNNYNDTKIKIYSFAASVNATLKVVDTDYKNYAVIYSCGDFYEFSSLQYVWIYSRSRNISKNYLDMANSTLNKNHIDTSPLVNSDQSYCDDKNNKN